MRLPERRDGSPGKTECCHPKGGMDLLDRGNVASQRVGQISWTEVMLSLGEEGWISWTEGMLPVKGWDGSLGQRECCRLERRDGSSGKRECSQSEGGMVLGCSSPQQWDGSASWKGGMLLEKQDEASGWWGGIMVQTGKAGCFQAVKCDGTSWRGGMMPVGKVDNASWRSGRGGMSPSTEVG